VATIAGPQFGARARFPIPPDIAADGGVWVSGKTSLAHVDPETEEVTRIAASKQILRITVGHNAAWAAATKATEQGPFVFRIDPATLDETSVADLGPQGAFNVPIATSLDSVWAGVTNTLVQVDPVTGEVVDRFHLDQAADEIAATSRDIWVVDRLTQSLGRFSTVDKKLVDTIVLQTAPDALAAGEGGDVWLVNTEAGTITPVRGGESREPIQVGSEPVDIVVGEDAVWVADQENGTVTRIDRSLGRVEEVIDIGGPVVAVTVDIGTGAVWAYVA